MIDVFELTSQLSSIAYFCVQTELDSVNLFNGVNCGICATLQFNTMTSVSYHRSLLKEITCIVIVQSKRENKHIVTHVS